jgi:DNA-binding Lrp family transcriptional regulator
VKLSPIGSQDLQILRSYMREAGVPWALSRARRPFRAMARDVGISEGTVWSRIKVLRKMKVLRGWNTMVNPSLAGMKVSAILLETSAEKSKAEIVERIGETDGVLNLVNFVGDDIAVQVCHRDEESLAEITRTISRLGAARVLDSLGYPFPPVSSRLSPTDMKIVMALSKDPRRNFDSIATELGVSPRTIRRRLDIIAKHNAIFAGPDVDFSSCPGIVPADMVVAYESQAAKEIVGAQIRSNLEEFLIREETGVPHTSIYVTALPSISKYREILSWSGSLRGIQYLHYGIVQEWRPRFERMGKFLEEAMVETTTLPQRPTARD